MATNRPTRQVVHCANTSTTSRNICQTLVCFFVFGEFASLVDIQFSYLLVNLVANGFLDDAPRVKTYWDDLQKQSGALKDMIPLSFPHTIGFDVSGKITEADKDVTSFKVGDAVFARPNQDDAGANAQITRVKANELALKPKTSPAKMPR